MNQTIGFLKAASYTEDDLAREIAFGRKKRNEARIGNVLGGAGGAVAGAAMGGMLGSVLGRRGSKAIPAIERAARTRRGAQGGALFLGAPIGLGVGAHAGGAIAKRRRERLGAEGVGVTPKDRREAAKPSRYVELDDGRWVRSDGTSQGED